MKKYIAVILSLVLCVCFFSCDKGNVPNDTVNSSGEIGALGENTDTSSKSETESVTEKTSENSGKESSKDTPTDSGTAESKTQTTTSHSETTGAQTTTSPQKQTETSTQKQTEPSTEKQTEPNSKITCTVQVECKSILNKKNKFKKDISLVPTEGVLLTPVKVYLDEGATAYDALKKACSENGVELHEEKSAFGIYIVGVGGIDEKDCGPQSGWVYTVNGQSPSVGLSNYKIKNGDSLVLSYVC